jgi:hypothetical protein
MPISDEKGKGVRGLDGMPARCRLPDSRRNLLYDRAVQTPFNMRLDAAKCPVSRVAAGAQDQRWVSGLPMRLKANSLPHLFGV